MLLKKLIDKDIMCLIKKTKFYYQIEMVISNFKSLDCVLFAIGFSK